MMGLILPLSYPLFLVVGIMTVLRKSVAPTVLSGIGHWFLAIGLAYVATFIITLAAVVLNPDIYVSDFYRLDNISQLHVSRFWSESIGIAVILLIFGVVLPIVDRLRRRGTKELAIDKISTLSLDGMAWVFTLLFIVTFLLWLFLLMGPYFDAQANADQVYAETHNRGLDPRDWFPFSWQWPGIILYHAAFWVWSFIAFFLPPLFIAHLITIKRIWQRIQRFERIAHLGSVATASLMLFFIWTIGGWIVYWLAD